MNKYTVEVLVKTEDRHFNREFVDVFAKNKTLAREAANYKLEQSLAQRTWEIENNHRLLKWKVSYKIETIDRTG